MSAVLRVEDREHAVVLTIDRPDAKNAVDLAVHDALARAIDGLSPEVRAVVITGAGESFVSGGDLKLIRERPFEESLELSRRMGALLDRLETLPVPVVAAINGWAFGGGLELALACDYRVVDRGAKLSFRQAAMGLTTGWGATVRLVRLVPRGTAIRLLSTSEILDAEEALRVGIADELAPAGGSVDAALRFAARVAEVSPRAVAGFKRVLQAIDRGEPEVEWEVFRELWGGEDHREALAAYFEKRRPRWGR